MRPFLPLSLGLLIVGLAPGGEMAMAVELRRADRPWTPENSIEMRYFALNFAEPRYWPGPGDNPNGVLFSPDRRHFLFVEYRGDVETDAAVAKVSIYNSAAVRRALRSRSDRVAPVRQFEMRARSSNIQAIAQIRWDEDSTGLLFEGADQAGTRTAYYFGIQSGDLRAVFAIPENGFRTFGYRNGTSLLVVSGYERRRPPSYPGQWLERGDDGTPLFDELQWRRARGIRTRVLRREARCAGRQAPVPDISGDVPMLAVSPSGCRALLVVARETAGLEFRLLDVSTGQSQTIATARRTGPKGISWSPDGQWAILSNISAASNAAGSVAMLSLATGELTSVIGLSVGSARSRFPARWLSATRVIVPDPGSATGASSLELRNGGWLLRPGADPAMFAREDGFNVGVRQSQNDPARVVATSGHAELVLSEPDPTLAGVARRDWREISFVAPDGRPAHAALMLPAPVPGRSGPPPLVVNPYWYENGGGSHDRLFLPDGQHDGAESAAQALAARGFAVLWMDKGVAGEDVRSGAEGEDFINRLDTVLEQLIRQNLVDARRIGMAGFSRGGYMTLYSATHPGRVPVQTHIAIDNNLGSSATAFYDRANGSVDPRQALNMFADRQGTMERDTLLNVDRVRGPVLFTRNLRGEGGTPEEGRFSVGLLTVQGAFLAARRPFDQLLFPDGLHQLMRPRERLTLMNAIVDWMAFWLMDQTPTDPERARVWTRLRADWQRQQAWEAAGNPVASTPPADFQPPIAR